MGLVDKDQAYLNEGVVMRKNIVNDDYQRLIDRALEDKSVKGLCVALIAFTGARANEILKIDSTSIVMTDGCAIQIKASKNGQDRWIPLPEELYAPVKGLQEKLLKRSCQMAALIGDCSKSVHNSYELIRLYFIKIQKELFGEQRHTLHSFRHSMAVRALKSGLDIIKVKAILGHRSIQATMFYLREYEQGLVLNEVSRIVRSKI